MQNLGKRKCKARRKEALKWEGWIDILHASARENLNNGNIYFLFLDGSKACYTCQDESLYGAVLVLTHISRFWAEGELNFSNGWYVNVKDLKLLDAKGILESIRAFCPEGSLFENTQDLALEESMD